MSIQWFKAVELMAPHVVRIRTPHGSGTGFLLSVGMNSPFCMIATAAHVVDHAHSWEEHIRLDHVHSSQSILLRSADRAIFLDEKMDTAAILLRKDSLPIPEEAFPLSPNERYLKVGNEIGWLGFPAISLANMCFFGGKISAWVQDQESYLVDGVAINGVSGGPAFHLTETGLTIIGVVSAYMPNRATGESLPGLAIIRSVAQFHALAPTFQSLDQAQEQQSPPTDTSQPDPTGDQTPTKIQRKDT